MTDEFELAPSSGRRRNMQAISSRDTQPEMALRRLLHSHGMRYRVCARPLPFLRRSADLVFGPSRVAVFVDGCFWHSCPLHGHLPARNVNYWAPKLARTVARDREVDAALADAGWLSIRIWEHEDSELSAARVMAAVNRRRPSRRLSQS